MYGQSSVHHHHFVQQGPGLMRGDPMYDPHAVRAPQSMMPNHAPVATLGPTQHGWSPYVNNGGTVMGLAGANPDGSEYAILAADTRMSNGYSICSRHVPKLFKYNLLKIIENGNILKSKN
jgi:hypothetical protein